MKYNLSVIGLDPGVASIGCAFIQGGKFCNKLVTTTASQSLLNRFKQAKKQLEKFKDCRFDYMCIEYQPPNVNNEILLMSGMLIDYFNPHAIMFLTPTQLKSVLTGNGNASKVEVAEALLEFLNVKHIEQLGSDHETDALALAVSALRYAKRK